MDKEIHITKPDEHYTVYCFGCGRLTGLQMLPIRVAGLIGGWIFGCKECLPKLYDMPLLRPEDAKALIEQREKPMREALTEARKQILHLEDKSDKTLTSTDLVIARINAVLEKV